jgi:ribosomal protein L13E
MKRIRFSKHAMGYAASRGFTVAEVEDAIRTSARGAAELGRLDCRKDFAYRREWNGKVYATKQVRPVFVGETEEIVVITVYTYYF